MMNNTYSPYYVTRTPTNDSAVSLSLDTDRDMFGYNFDTVLYQFLETGTSDRCLIYRLTPEILRF